MSKKRRKSSWEIKDVKFADVLRPEKDTSIEISLPVPKYGWIKILKHKRKKT